MLLSNKVIRIDDSRIGELVEWSDDHTAALVLWDGWMGTDWVKQHEMVVVQDLVMEALTDRRSIERVVADEEGYPPRRWCRLMALDIALEAAKVQ